MDGKRKATSAEGDSKRRRAAHLPLHPDVRRFCAAISALHSAHTHKKRYALNNRIVADSAVPSLFRAVYGLQVVPESKQYLELLDFEKQLDALMVGVNEYFPF